MGGCPGGVLLESFPGEVTQESCGKMGAPGAPPGTADLQAACDSAAVPEGRAGWRGLSELGSPAPAARPASVRGEEYTKD